MTKAILAASKALEEDRGRVDRFEGEAVTWPSTTLEEIAVTERKSIVPSHTADDSRYADLEYRFKRSPRLKLS